MAIDEEFGDPGVHGAFIVALVLYDLSLDDLIRLNEELRRAICAGLIESIGDLSQMVESGLYTLVILAQGDASAFWHLLPT